jgi:hypothetical protein
MKSLPCVLLLALGLAARADVIIEQKIESTMLTGNMVMKLKGDQARIDVPAGPAGPATIIMNTTTGDMTTLLHAQKMALKMNRNDAQKQAGLDASKMEKPKDTGVSEKVGQWTAEIYEFNVAGMTGKIWAAKDFPNAAALKEQLLKLSAANSGGFDPNKMDVPGIVVKTQLTTPAGPMTTTLIKAEEAPVAASEFTIPTGYNEMKMPTTPTPAP